MTRRLLVLFCLLVVLCPALALAAKARKNVLYLNSYQNGYPWSDNILQGLRQGFAQAPFSIDLQIEYMDSKKYMDPDLQAMLHDFYKHKFRNFRFDVVLASDNAAFDFLRRYRDELFPGVPVVFCGVNDFHDSWLTGHPDFTGVLENPDIRQTLELAVRFHPGRKRLIIFGDTSVTGMAIENQIRAVEHDFAGRLQFVYEDNLSLPNILKHVRGLSDDAMVFLIPFYKNARKDIYSVNEVLAAIRENSDVPVYSAWLFMLGHGIVGGHLHSGEEEGRLAAGMAVKILEGVPASSLPIIQGGGDVFAFDNKELLRLGIDTSKLPSDATLINAPSPFYRINIAVFWTIIISLIVLCYVLVLLVTNILRRRQVEDAIKDQLTFLETLINTIPLPIYFKDGSGTYKGCNPAFRRWCGLETGEPGPGEGGEQACRSLADSPVSRFLAAEDAALLREPGVRAAEVEINGVDAQPRTVILHKAVYAGVKGGSAGLVGVLYDITERKRAAEDLRLAEEMLRLVLDNVPQLVAWKDKDLRYIGANRAYLEFFGFTNVAEIKDLDDYALPFRREDADAVRAADVDVMRHDRPMFGELAPRGIRGQDVILEIKKVPLHGDGGAVVGVLTTAEDVTRKVSLERQLLQSQKMEAIGTLAGGIAHDFNNILTSIINSAELALMDVPPGTAMEDDVRRVLTAGERGSRLVKQILSFARPSQAGFVPIDVVEVITEAVALLSASAPRNIRIDVQTPAEPLPCLADPTQLHQILMNLCTNAIQAMREGGGALTLSLSSEDLDEDQAGQVGTDAGRYARLSVADTGPGIPVEIVDKIFDPFFSTKKKGEGTGLGLAVARSIVKNHRGGIRVTSQPGTRTCFDVYLPLPAEPRPACPLPRPVLQPGRDRILFVEDDTDQLLTIPRLLVQLGHGVTARSGAAAALERITDDPDGFDVLVTDYDMPDMDGLELARRVAELNPELPVIVVSGRVDDIKESLLPPNVRKVVAKPYNQSILSAAISEVRRRGHRTRAA